MKLAIFSPYGFFSREAGLMYLVANYLAKSGAEVLQLRCDGAFAVCGRDRKHRWNRTTFSCARCVGEQKALARWATLKSRDLSSFLLPDDVMQTARWISAVRIQDLPRLEFRGMQLWQLCKGEMQVRFPESNLIQVSPQEERCARELCITAVHAIVATERFVAANEPTLTFIVNNDDVLANAYVAQMRVSGAETAVFSLDAGEEAISIESLRTGDRYQSRLILEGITSMRNDPKTWAPEVMSIVHEMLTFLGYAPDLVPVHGT